MLINRWVKITRRNTRYQYTTHVHSTISSNWLILLMNLLINHYQSLSINYSSTENHSKKYTLITHNMHPLNDKLSTDLINYDCNSTIECKSVIGDQFFLHGTFFLCKKKLREKGKCMRNINLFWKSEYHTTLHFMFLW